MLIFSRTVMKYSLTFLPSTLIAYVCLVLSQREVLGTIETFSVFNTLSAVSMVYIVFTSTEDRYIIEIVHSFNFHLQFKVVWCLQNQIF